MEKHLKACVQFSVKCGDVISDLELLPGYGVSVLLVLTWFPNRV
jgi:hypothetical protein